MKNRKKMLAQRDILRSKNQDLLKQIADLEALMDAPSTDQASRLTLTPLLVELYDDHWALTAQIADLIEAIPYPRKSRAKIVQAYYRINPIRRTQYEILRVIAFAYEVLRKRKK